MKRILLITESLGSGGAERQICGLAAMLTSAGYPCRLVTYVENQFYEPYLRKNGVDYELVPKLRNKYTRVFRIVKYVREYKPDVIISYLPSVNMTMCLAKLFFRGKLIVSERNNDDNVDFRSRMLFNLYRMADAIVPNSQVRGEFICRKFPLLSDKVRPIINFVDVERFCPPGVIRRSDVIRIVTVARYTPQKNVLKFLEVVSKVKELRLKVHFDWYGDKKCNPSYFSSVETAYKRLCIDEYLTLHESYDRIEEIYRSSDVFCLPSLYEGYPNVVVEAMASGLPVICSNCYENPYIVEDGVNGFLFNPENVEEMVSAVRKVLELSPEERNEMGLRNRNRCLERNTKEIFLKSYIGLIDYDRI